MKNLYDRTQELLEDWKANGICIECFSDLGGSVLGHSQPHAEWCSLSEPQE